MIFKCFKIFSSFSMHLCVSQSKMMLKFTSKIIPKYEMSRSDRQPKRSTSFPSLAAKSRAAAAYKLLRRATNGIFSPV